MGRTAHDHRRWLPLAERQQRCIGCHRAILWGDRCEDCKRKLRQRQRRKLHR
jgi:hypothetical protein